ncbi:hypothetical protein SHV74_05820 [Pseudomonas capeferrum]|jgi:hypothetical protein|uniref:hypothetical protein n=1 Tax=Pseudomonas capeferrum TaxID=1495066 RepID=UPI00397BD3C1
MMIFDEPFHVDTDNKYVMVGSKTPEQVDSDLRAGVARIGGFWRHPSYFEAYLHSASLLVEQGQATGTLDEIGLPGFYLQRHATELLLKELLSWMVSISELRNVLGVCQTKPSAELMLSLGSSHDLAVLHRHILEFGATLDLPLPPPELGRLIEDMAKFEITPTWSRYSLSSRKAKGRNRVVINHVPKELVIPIVEFQNRLSGIATLVASREAFGESYEDELHNIWAGLSAAADH